MVHKFIKFPKIGQFRNTVTDIKHSARFEGLGEDNQPIYNNDKLPTIEFTGTVKLHGTNAGVVRSPEGEIYAQSRNNVVDSGHFNFVGFVKNNQDSFEFLFSQVRSDHNIDWDKNSIAIFGEWAGPGVQKGVAISEIPEKMFFIFGVKIAPEDEELDNYWVSHSELQVPNDRIHNLHKYEYYVKSIDFSQPKMVINELIDITNAVEKECPVAKSFGISGIGEGVVWEANFKGSNYRFKVKGEAHAGKSKIKKLKAVDDEKLNKINEVVNQVTPLWRLDQFLTEVCNLNTGGVIERSKLGDYIRAVINDVMVEEIDIINEAGLEPKEINKTISAVAKEYFFEQEKENF